MNKLGSRYKEFYDSIEVGNIIEIEDVNLRFGLILKVYVASYALMITDGNGGIFTLNLDEGLKAKIVGKINLKELIELNSKL